jgi:hypothetical protein
LFSFFLATYNTGGDPGANEWVQAGAQAHQDAGEGDNHIITRCILYMFIQYVYIDILTVLYSIVDKPLYIILYLVYRGNPLFP